MTSQNLFFDLFVVCLFACLFFAIQRFEYHLWVEHDEEPPQPGLTLWKLVHGGPRYGRMNTLLAPFEISVNWLGSKQS